MSKVRIIVSSNSGFCFGVKRALDIAKNALEKGCKTYSLGPIIHNPQVVQEFSEKGLKIIKNVKDIKSKNALALIPSHGISPNVIKKKKITYIDTTCPLVERVQKIVRELKKKGYFIVIVGNTKHPEVLGLKGIAGRHSCVLNTKQGAVSLDLKSKRIALISQTTATVSNFKEILSEIIKKDFTELVSFNTVCRNTIDRQKEAQEIARTVDAMLVIGGKNSANTSRLVQICKKVNKNTHHIESRNDLRMEYLRNKKRIGIATGASTPPYAIQEVINKINEATTHRAPVRRSFSAVGKHCKL